VTRKPGRLCGALPWTTTVSLILPKSNSPIRKEERLATKLRGPVAHFVSCCDWASRGSTNESLAQSNKSSDVGIATKGRRPRPWWWHPHPRMLRSLLGPFCALLGWLSTFRCIGDTGNENLR